MEKTIANREWIREELCVSMTLVDRLLKRKNDPIPSIRVGRRVLIPIDSFQKWLARQTENGMNGVVDQ